MARASIASSTAAIEVMSVLESHRVPAGNRALRAHPKSDRPYSRFSTGP